MDNIKRQKIIERDDFDYEERMKIQAKSKDRCCHCGKICFPGYGATVEHFVPIAKGGTNRMLNLVMLCSDCNKEKGSKIYEPETYLKYLEEPHKTQITDYFEGYVRSFEYFENKNVLACDRYEYCYYPPYTGRASFDRRKLRKQPPAMKVRLDKIDFDPFTDNASVNEAIEYMTKYFAKHKINKDPVGAVLSFINNGCLYSMRKTGGIACLAGVTIRQILNFGLDKDGEKTQEPIYDVVVCLMPLYNNEAAFNITATFARSIPQSIMYEQGLNFLPSTICAFKEDGWLDYYCNYFHCKQTKNRRTANDFIETRFAYGMQTEESEVADNDKKKAQKFLAAVYEEPTDAPDWFKRLTTSMW